MVQTLCSLNFLIIEVCVKSNSQTYFFKDIWSGLRVGQCDLLLLLLSIQVLELVYWLIMLRLSIWLSPNIPLGYFDGPFFYNIKVIELKQCQSHTCSPEMFSNTEHRVQKPVPLISPCACTLESNKACEWNDRAKRRGCFSQTCTAVKPVPGLHL